MKLTDELDSIEYEANKILNLLDKSKIYDLENCDDLYIQIGYENYHAETMKYGFSAWDVQCAEGNNIKFSSLDILSKCIIRDFLIGKL